ncbi:MAG: hypothetical protein CL559_15370 [Alphaproteobacteria bacterium]|nr:hypothetical protein [Alphaproteobacteria bacterium]
MANSNRNLHKRVTLYEARAAAEVLRRRGFEAAPEFRKLVDRLFGDLPVDVSKINHKSKTRIAQKAIKDHDGIVDLVGDAIRVKITCQTTEEVQQVQQILWRQQELAIACYGRPRQDTSKPAEPVITRIKDNFAEPKRHGYRAMNAKIRMPNGVIAEIQVVHSAIEAANAQTHGTYKQLTTLERSVGKRAYTEAEAERRTRLINRLARIYDRISIRSGLDSLMTSVARQQMEERRQNFRAGGKRGPAALLNRQAENILPSGPLAMEPGRKLTRLQASARLMSNESHLDSLSVKIDWLLDLKDQLQTAGPKASPESASQLAEAINELAQKWHQLPEPARTKMIDGGIAPVGGKSHTRMISSRPKSP